MKTKRVFAYIIDIFLISFLASIIFAIAYKDTNYADYMEKNKMYLDNIRKSGSSDPDNEELVDIVYDLSKTEIPLSIITLGATVLYFGIISFMFNGKTIGKKIMKIQVVPLKGKKLNPGLYMLREIILTNSLFKLLDIINISLASKSNWIVYNTVLTYAENLVIVVLLGVMIFRTDERSLHDLICQTNVVEIEKTK